MRRWIGLGVFPLLACAHYFHQAPPEIGAYPQRIATKNWQQIFEENSPRDPAVPDRDQLSGAYDALPRNLKDLDIGGRLALIDGLLAANRAGDYSVEQANRLHEVREIAADPALFDMAGPYLVLRNRLEVPQPRPPAGRPWDMEEWKYEKLRNEFRESMALRRQKVLMLMGNSRPELLPYLIVRLGAEARYAGSHAEAAAIFESVVANFPDHPRAEAAWLAGAVCRIQVAREVARAAAREAPGSGRVYFEGKVPREQLIRFIARFPDGRFTADALGWLGAIAYEKRNYGEAVRWQLARLERQPTREVTRGVLRECDVIFARLFEIERDPVYGVAPEFDGIDKDRTIDPDAIARHPLVARLFLQHALDPALTSLAAWDWTDNRSADRWRINFVNQRVFSTRPLVRAALPALCSAMLKSPARQAPVTLMLSAWSATEAGEHLQALALLERIEGNLSDEALLAEAIILQRLGRHEDAIGVFNRLEKEYPGSPLNSSLPERRAISLFHSGRMGEAAIAFIPRERKDGHFAANLMFEHQGAQWFQTILQFAPLDDLAATFARQVEGSPARELLGDTLRHRYLASGDFASARKLSMPEAVRDVRAGFGSFPDPLGWDEAAGRLETLYRELEAAADVEKPAIHLALAREWLAGSGGLTSPGAKLDLQQRKNAIKLGFAEDAVNREMDRRDEETQALAHLLKAGKSQDAGIAAPALELASERLLAYSNRSPYERARLIENGATAVSRRCYDELRSRFPASAEARRAVFHTFLPEPAPWIPDPCYSDRAVQAVVSAIRGTADKGSSADGSETNRSWAVFRSIRDQAASIPEGEQPGETLARVASLNDRLRELVVDRDSREVTVELRNKLEDQITAASLPGVSRNDLVEYFGGNYAALPPAFASLARFRQIVDRDRSLGDYKWEKVDNFRIWDDFLIVYPHSPKAEAASLRRLRGLAREFHPNMQIDRDHARLVVTRSAANDPARLLRLIGEHESKYPGGRYRQDLNLWRAVAMMDLGRDPEAIAHLLDILEDPAQPDLHEETALLFCDLSQRLLEPERRAAAAAIFRGDSRGLAMLKRLVYGETYLARLRPLIPWLEAP